MLRGYTQEVPAGKAADLHDTLNVLDKYLSNGMWAAADHYTIADFHALPTVTNIQVRRFSKVIIEFLNQI